MNALQTGVRALAPLLAGAVIGAATMIGLVYSQTQAPATNPADQEVLVYGTR